MRNCFANSYVYFASCINNKISQFFSYIRSCIWPTTTTETDIEAPFTEVRAGDGVEGTTPEDRDVDPVHEEMHTPPNTPTAITISPEEDAEEDAEDVAAKSKIPLANELQQNTPDIPPTLGAGPLPAPQGFMFVDNYFGNTADVAENPHAQARFSDNGTTEQAPHALGMHYAYGESSHWATT